MKKLTTTILLLLLAGAAFGQGKSDSLAYQLQRQKINSMLAKRSQKFGQYQQSLTMHTGIFGLQTKKDIRRSNEILMDIAKTDDDIYAQLKILLEFRTFQQTQVQKKSTEVEDTRLGFMTTINKLRDQIDKLKAQAKQQQDDYDKIKRNFIIATIAAGLLVLLVLRRGKKPVVTKSKTRAIATKKR